MEPNIFEKIKRYIAAGGNSSSAVQELSDGYQGYGPMSSLVVGWTRKLAARAPQEVAAKPVHDEAYFLSELAKQHFTADKVANVFSHGRPKWLINLISSREGRQLVYDLSASHHCGLLSYAIQQIMMHGNEAEVASIGAPLAAYFMVFHTLLASRLREVPAAPPARLASIAQELKDSCCQSQHTYAYVQLLLEPLARLSDSSRYRRLSQELEACVAHTRGAIAWQMAGCFAPSDSSDADNEAMLTALSYLCTTDAPLAAAAASHLNQLYTSFNPPSISVLRHPQLLRRLADDLFGGGLDAQHREVVASLLALGSTAVDARAAGGDLDRQDVAEAVEALHAAAELGAVAAAGQRLTQAQLAAAQLVAQAPAAACGLLGLLQRRAAQAAYWRDSAHAFAAPTCLALLVPLVQHQPRLHGQALEVVGAALAVLGSSKPETVRCFLQAAVMLLQGPEAMAVMQRIEKWSQASADPSLVRSFVFQALAVAAPPYSPEFASILVRLMAGSNVKRNRGIGRSDEQIRHLEEFARAVAGLDFRPPLSLRESSFLQDLRVSV